MPSEDKGWTEHDAKGNEVKRGDLTDSGTSRRLRRANDDDEDFPEAKGGRRELQEGWGISSSVPKKTKMLDEPVGEDVPIGRGRRTVAEMSDENETEITIIPDLDEQAEEDIALQVAVAPKTKARRLPTIEELDLALVGIIPTLTTEKGTKLDLSCLTKALIPSESVVEDKEPWQFDSLLQGVTQEIAADAETAAELRKNLPTFDDDKSPFDNKADDLEVARRRPIGGRRAVKINDQQQDEKSEEPAKPPPKGGRRAPKRVAAKSQDDNDSKTTAPPINGDDDDDDDDDDDNDDDEAK